jgi:arginine deiminase
MKIVAEETEEVNFTQMRLPTSTKGDLQFWSKIEGGDVFRISKKRNAKGISNSIDFIGNKVFQS